MNIITITGFVMDDLSGPEVTVPYDREVYNSKLSAQVGVKELQERIRKYNDRISTISISGTDLFFEAETVAYAFDIREIGLMVHDKEYHILKNAIAKNLINLEKHCNDTEFTWRGHTVTIGPLSCSYGQIGYSITFDGLNFYYDYELKKFELAD